MDIKDVKTAELVKKYNFKFSKSLGQNFLVDDSVPRDIVLGAEVNEEDLVIEIGPGVGTLTAQLLKIAKRVVAIELDDTLIPILTEELGGYSNFSLIHNDALKVNFDEIIGDEKSVKLVANLPYYITTAIIEKVVLGNFGIDEMIVMVQKEVALKMTGIYKNPLLLMIKDMGTIEYLFTVNKNVFMPAPHVDSAILKIELKKAPDLKLYEVLNICFKQRRKTILNNLKQSYEEAEEILLQTGIENRKRSEELELADFKNITKMI